MSLSHNVNSDNFPSDQLVEKAMEAIRSQWIAKGFDEAMCSRLNQRIQELASFPCGRFFIVNGGMNGYWTNFFGSGDYLNIQKIRQLYESENFYYELLGDSRHEQELLLRNIIRPLLKPNASVASVPCGLMSEVLMAADHFENVKLYAIDIDKTNFDLIREKYGDRLVGNEFHTLEMDALTLDFECQFDLITCLGFVCYIKEESIPDFLSRIHRALKPGGRVLLSFLPDTSEHSPKFKFDPIRNPIAREILMCVPVRFQTRLSTSKLVHLFSQAGFVCIIIHGGTNYHFPVIDAKKQ